ncbi:Phage virion morphogenesis protein [uncultured Desulfobacterium sp.]|uniref:Phage virion morphogenesis protein n=1 Tax=uncultured Desulfobacterium sp. TaxID=201089 RepID=A0A445MWQ5_9BACT|nr:Phage virion morphogenesis protein [uncultured Desulfobacterium sp.]
MSVALHVDLSGLKALEDRIDRLAGLSSTSLRQLLDDIGELVETQTTLRLREEKTSPEGADWPGLDPTYLARKRKKSSGGTLEFGGDLINSMTHNVIGEAVEVGSNLVYAATHQEGDEERNIKARPYLGLSSENEDDVADLVDTFIDGLLLN